MITEFQIDLDKESCIPWAGKVRAFERRTSLGFQPGLNVLWSPNGYGKTSILLAMARMLFCAQGGVQKITWQAIKDAGYRAGLEHGYQGLRPVHDGCRAMFCDPSIAVGRGEGYFDWDFGQEGLLDVMLSGSSGQTTTRRLDTVLQALVDGKFPEISAHVQLPGGGGVSRDEELVGRIMEDLGGGGGRSTVLLDEPDRSLDMPMQARLWTGLYRLRDKAQIIASSHSIFALGWPEAHYIDLEFGYLRKSLEAAAAMPDGITTQLEGLES